MTGSFSSSPRHGGSLRRRVASCGGAKGCGRLLAQRSLDITTEGGLSTTMVSQRQSLLTPRYCRRCGGLLARSASGYTCTECGTVREPIRSTRDFIIVRPSQRAEAEALAPVPMAWSRRRTVRTSAIATANALANWAVAARHLLAAVALTLSRLVRQAAADFQVVATSTSDWTYPLVSTSIREARHWASERVAQARESLADLAEHDWNLDRSIPGIGSSVVPIVILAVAVALALGLGGAIAAALS